MPLLGTATGGLLIPSGTIVIAASALPSLVAALNTIGKPLDAAKLHLFTNADLSPNKLTALAAFTEPTYAAYAAQTIVWGTPFVAADGTGILAAPGLTFGVASSAEATTVYGVFATDSAGTVLLYSEKFDAPFSMSDETRDLVYIPEFPLQTA